MPKNYYLPSDDSGKAELLEHLAARLPIHAAALELSPDDITQLKAAETEVQRLSHFDSLTGLPNRRYFEDALERAVAEAAGAEPGAATPAFMLALSCSDTNWARAVELFSRPSAAHQASNSAGAIKHSTARTPER